ncbi:MAG: ABC transporter permease, partial [Angelakisella sp.]
IAIKWITYLQYVAWKDPKQNGFPKMPKFVEAAVLPKVFGVHIGWIIALVAAALVYVLFKYTKLGYEIAVLGESTATARYAGMSVNKTIILAVMLSGGLCGLAGMMQASAIEKSLSDVLSGGMGFTAIITAWLSRLSPPVIVVVCFLFSVLMQGGSYIQTAMQIPSSVAEILQGVILFFVLGSEFFVNYSLHLNGTKKEAK